MSTKEVLSEIDVLESIPESPAVHNFVGEFADKDLEREYRRTRLPSGARQLLLLMVIVLPANAIWLISDYNVSANGPSFTLMLLVRATIIVCGALLVLAGFRTKSPPSFDFYVILAAVVSIGGVFFFDLTRPNDYFGHYTIDILAIVALYFAAPLPLRLQGLCAITYSVVILAFYFEYKVTEHVALYNFTIPLSVALATVIGFLASRSLAIRSRNEYFLLGRERRARSQLQSALDNIKTLSGLLPICASCKKIRDDKGYWNHVEAYFAERSDVVFTHGLCPDCRQAYTERDSTQG